ncbi:unnamed protein product, partial [Darwinula stevensoni]
MKIDENGDSEGNFTVLSLQREHFDYSTRVNNYQCPFYMVEVGRFLHHVNRSLPDFRLHLGSAIEWSGGIRPPDEPACGYHGQKCVFNRETTREVRVLSG